MNINSFKIRFLKQDHNLNVTLNAAQNMHLNW